jgi:hypothetical protein
MTITLDLHILGVTILLAVILLLAWKTILLAYKVGYYEQTFKNNKNLFSEERYKHIEEVMNKKTPF